MSLPYIVTLVLIVSATTLVQTKNIHRLKPYFENEDMIPTWMKLRRNSSLLETGSSTDEVDRTWGTIWNWITGGGGSSSGGGTSSGTSPGIAPGIAGASGELSSEDVTMNMCDCSCGQANSRLRIVGGVETRVKQYPWMAMLMYDGRFYCGATLINQNYVLTAAHCVEGFTPRRIKVRLLEHDRNNGGETIPVNRGVATTLVHNGYNQNTFNNDIALLRLDNAVPFTSEMRPACLPDKGKRYTGEDGIVTGWGKVAENKPVSPVLREVTVPVLSNTKCGSYYGTSQITDNMLCAGYAEGGRDSCQGDSGGPLHFKNGTFHQIIGVVSWGEGCARPRNPGVYARVNRYLSWISANTAGTCFCQP